MKYILTFFLFGTLFAHAQNKLNFSYDSNTGSQILRVFCLTCQNKSVSENDIKEIEALTDEDLQKFYPEDVISYYPNPVREELYIKWEFTNDTYVQSIQIINVNGQVMNSYQNKKEINSQNIPFQTLSAGVYIISLSYNTGEQKTIKIIKQ